MPDYGIKKNSEGYNDPTAYAALLNIRKEEIAQQQRVSELMRVLKYIIDKSGFEDCDAVFAVINTFSKKRNSLVSVDVDLQRIYDSNLHGVYLQLNQGPIPRQIHSISRFV